MSSVVGSLERSRARSQATICSLVGRAAILHNSAATQAANDIPADAARSLRVVATSSDTSRMYRARATTTSEIEARG